MISTFILLVIFFNKLSAQCSTLDSCVSCAGVTNGPFTCRWCLDTSRCVSGMMACQSSTVVSSYNCPRNISSIVFPEFYLGTRVVPMIRAASLVLEWEENREILPILETLPSNGSGIIRYRNATACHVGDASVIVVSMDSLKEVLIAFDSSMGVNEIIAQIFDFLLNRQEPYQFGGKVLTYYNSCFLTLWKVGLGNFLQAYLNGTGMKSWNILVTGAGVGGSLASMLIPALSSLHPLHIRLITIGQTRTGDIEFAINVEKNAQSAFRVVVGADLVADMPKRIGDSLDLGHHFAFEVYYPNGLSHPYIICDQPETPTCSMGVFFKVPWLNMLYLTKYD
ncbi:unnamed protein product, partial [Mesorhabditis belari]|uniref:Fungal lipase-like domain-containing protein n=1 Tax=Mesorhabditis belari TaxID=2138241 RepID=A0AAF3J6L9_9BILA